MRFQPHQRHSWDIVTKKPLFDRRSGIAIACRADNPKSKFAIESFQQISSSGAVRNDYYMRVNGIERGEYKFNIAAMRVKLSLFRAGSRRNPMPRSRLAGPQHILETRGAAYEVRQTK